jgi:hypothetical protein
VSWSVYLAVRDCSHEDVKLGGVSAELINPPRSKGITNSEGLVSLSGISDDVGSVEVRLTRAGYESDTISVPQPQPDPGGPSPQPRRTCLLPTSPKKPEKTPPVISDLEPQPASISASSRVKMTLTSSDRPCKKFLIWWTEEGAAKSQGEVEPGANVTATTWTTDTVPGLAYTFKAEGYAGVDGWSKWGPEVNMVAPSNLRSLRQYLLHSSVDPVGENLGSLGLPAGSLRRFMKL